MEDKNKKNEIKVGIVSIIGILLFIGAIVYTKSGNLNENHQILFCFDNSLGIASGAPIVLNGVKIGNVKEIWNQNNKAFVQGEVFGDVSSIKSDATAMISILEITGGKKIEVIAGNSEMMYDFTKTMQGLPSTDISKIINEFGKISEQVSNVLTKIDTSVVKTFTDDKFVNKFNEIIKNTNEITVSLNNLIKTNENKINLAVNNFTELTNEFNDYKHHIDRIINNIDTLSNQLNKVTNKGNQTLDSVNTLVNNVNTIVSDVKNNNTGLLSRIIYDKKLSQEIDTILVKLDTLATNITKYGINANIRLGGRP